ncbi:MAG: hypothetical protein JKX84_02585 [Flavobacteriales bacterium]|nr:hypothetical protein [Flavobacteriales bacterium]
MRNIFLLIILLTSCAGNPHNFKDSCHYFHEGKKYFEEHFHEDYFDEGTREATIVILDKAAKQGCEEYQLYYLLYTCHVWTGGNLKAIENLTKAMRIDPAEYENFLKRGQVRMKLGDLEGATKDFLIYASYPNAENLSSAYYMVGAIYYSQGDSLNSAKYRGMAEYLVGSLRKYDGYCRAKGLIK